MDKEIEEPFPGQTLQSKELKDYYDVLNITKNASEIGIKQAYDALIKTFSSDNDAMYSLMDEGVAEENAIEVEEAYKNLMNLSARIDHDRELVDRNITDLDNLSPYVREVLKNEKRDAYFQNEFSDNLEQTFEKIDDFSSPPIDSYNSSLPLDGGTHYKGKQRLNLTAKSVAGSDVKDKIKEIISKETCKDGAFLKQIRNVADIEIEELQEQTKISYGCIVALEENYFDRLPQLVYVKGFLRSYLRFLGLESKDSENIVSSYIASYRDWLEKQTSSK